jgi:hypothetical protein
MAFRVRLKVRIAVCPDHALLGTLSAWVWKVGYQQRGLPHAHTRFGTGFDTNDVCQTERHINERVHAHSAVENDVMTLNDYD